MSPAIFCYFFPVYFVLTFTYFFLLHRIFQKNIQKWYNEQLFHFITNRIIVDSHFFISYRKKKHNIETRTKGREYWEQEQFTTEATSVIHFKSSLLYSCSFCNCFLSCSISHITNLKFQYFFILWLHVLFVNEIWLCRAEWSHQLSSFSWAVEEHDLCGNMSNLINFFLCSLKIDRYQRYNDTKVIF